MEKRQRILNVLFSVLLFGGLWSIMEATLGTFLHLPFIEGAGLFLTSSTIIVPLAYMIMGACYKRTNNYRSLIYMGIMAASTKAIICAIFHLDPTPALYILVEALAGSLALLVIRPKEIISFKGLGTFILANTLYLTASIFIRFNVLTVSGDSVLAYFEKYILKCNMLATLYTFLLGAIIYGFIQLSTKYEWKFEGFKKVLYSPITASVVACLMIAVSIVLR